MGLAYYILDTETTGVKAGWHEVVEISIIRCSDRHQLTRFIKAEYPERADERALMVTGKSIPDLMNGDSKEDVIGMCERFFDQDGLTPSHRCIIGHNVSFDKRFCHAMWESVGRVFPAVCWLDTLKVSKEWAKKIGRKPDNFQLSTLLKFADVKLQNVHSAEGDTRNLYIFWKKHLSKLNTVSMIKREPHLVK